MISVSATNGYGQKERSLDPPAFLDPAGLGALLPQLNYSGFPISEEGILGLGRSTCRLPVEGSHGFEALYTGKI